MAVLSAEPRADRSDRHIMGARRPEAAETWTLSARCAPGEFTGEVPKCSSGARCPNLTIGDDHHGFGIGPDARPGYSAHLLARGKVPDEAAKRSDQWETSLSLQKHYGR